MIIRAVWGDLLAEKVPILALKCGLIRQVDRKHRIACIVNRDLNWGFEKKINILYRLNNISQKEKVAKRKKVTTIILLLI